MSTKRVISNTIYYGVVPKLTILANAILLPIITPYLTTFDYGVQGIISSYTGVIAMIAPLGLNVHLTNSFYEYPQKFNLIWGRILFLFLFSGVLFGSLNVLLLNIVLPFSLSFELLFLSLLGSMQIFLFANTWLAQHLFPLVERPKPLVFGNLAASCLGLAVSFVIIYYFHLGYWGLIASVAISSTASFVIFIKYVWIDFNIRPIIEKNRKRLREMLLMGLPLVPHSIGFVLLSSSARIVMTWYQLPYDDIGLFSHGCTMGDYIIIITTALTTAIVPQMQVSFREGDYKRYRRLYYLCQSVALISSAMICIWMGDIYSILIRNNALAKSSEIAMLMCFANVVYPFYCFMSTPVFIEKNTKQLLWLVFLPGFLNILLCTLLIPIWGYKIAVFSTMMSYWSQLMIPFVIGYYTRCVGMWFGNLGKIWLVLLILISVVALSNFAGNMNIVWRISFSLVLLSIFVACYYRYRNLIFV